MPNGIHKLERFFARKNLERLSHYDISEITGHPQDKPDDKCQLTFELLKHWTKENKASIDKSIADQVFGGKNPINWHIAFLPFMESAAVYRRDYGVILEARRKYMESRGKPEAPGAAEKLGESIDDYIKAAEGINHVAELWGMKFVQICDLPEKSPDGHPKWSGPYCGAFLSTDKQKSKPFIGLAFKGTNPFRLPEDKTDLNYRLIPAGDFLRNQLVSEGVYTGLFGDFQDQDPPEPSDSFKPYNFIIEQLQAYAEQLPQDEDSQVRLHVTGHSLGGSYSTMCFSQLLIHSTKFSTRFDMGDEYTFGAPRVGSQDFGVMNREISGEAEGQIWRIVNNADVVPQVPPTDLIDAEGFYHVDNGVHIWDDKAPELINTEIGKDPPKGKDFKTIKGFLSAVWESKSHLPNEYRDSLRYAISLMAEAEQ